MTDFGPHYISPTDLAWIAGFWEGEGTVGFYNVKRTRKGKVYRSNRLYGTITQINREILVWIRKTMKLGNIGTQINNKKNSYGWTCRRIYRYAIANNMARTFFQRIKPYVRSPHKKKQLLKALKADRKGIKGRWN